MIPIQTILAINIGKVASVLSRTLRVGGGTNFPGTLARRIAPGILRTLANELPHGTILLSGTNGKTTTTRMVATILRDDGYEVLHNRAGANLVTGLTATALARSTIVGHLAADIGLFETDEAALPQALAETQPRLVIIHNLFRDQLDRYGEVDTLAQAWHAALATLPSTARVLLNADDPAVAYLGSGLAAQVTYYGLDDVRHATGAASHTADSHFCRQCGTRYGYPLAFYGHVGHYVCPNCGHRRPQPHISLARLDLVGAERSRLFITYPGGAVEIRLPLPGLYNALNALAATAAALTMGIAPARIRASLETFSAAFGRIERLQAGPGGAPMMIALIKNPVGASETVRMLTAGRAPASQSLSVLVAINDLHADGTDVSWLWDADFEPLAAHAAHIVVSGVRAADMAVRLKYAGVEPGRMVLEPDLSQAVDRALEALPSGATLFVLPTYTAMLHLRSELARRGWVRPYWEE
jgi:UDP-N-acetylmuramyl tripeptide synthase